VSVPDTTLVDPTRKRSSQHTVARAPSAPRPRERSRTTPSLRDTVGPWQSLLPDMGRSLVALVPLLLAWLLAELFYDWGSFSLNLAAFGFTWFAIDAVWRRARRWLDMDDR
jgi:hypothetical protein